MNVLQKFPGYIPWSESWDGREDLFRKNLTLVHVMCSNSRSCTLYHV